MGVRDSLKPTSFISSSNLFTSLEKNSIHENQKRVNPDIILYRTLVCSTNYAP